MAIMGFLVHVAPKEALDVERLVSSMPEMTTYGIHQECYIVAVAEGHSRDMEGLLQRIQALDGVLTSYVTSLNVEDELDDFG